MHEYVVKLRKAERALENPGGGPQTEAPQQAQQAQMMAQQHAQQQMMAQQQQQGGYSGGGYYDENQSHNQMGHPSESEYEQSQVLAAGADRKSGMPQKKVAAGNVDDDHFADVDLDDNLLPT